MKDNSPEVLEALEEDFTPFYDDTFFRDISQSKVVSYLINQFKTSLQAVILMDENLVIYWGSLGFMGDFHASYFPVPLNQLFQIDKDHSPQSSFPKRINLQTTNGYLKTKLIRHRKGRSSIRSNLTITPLVDRKNNRVLAYMGLLDDITDDYRHNLRKTFRGLLEASKLKDDDTGNHIERVNEYSSLLARHLYGKEGFQEITPDFLDQIGFLAAMHDVGKIGTPDDILHKRGPLDEREWKIMQEHTINGAIILSSYPSPMAKEIARSHHEKWDGSGYPYGLMGRDIPLAARIVTIADVYDALRSKRSYKEAFSHEKTMDLMGQDVGSHFDPDLMDMVFSIHTKFEAIFDQLLD